MDIRVDTTWRTHGKRKRLQRVLGPAGPLAVMDLWLAIAEQYPDGKMPDCDAQDIADMAQWHGRDASRFVAVLCDERTRFLDPLPNGGWQAHNWELRQSWVVSSPKRHLRAVQAASARWIDKVEAKEDATSNALSIGKHCTKHAQSNAPLLSSPSLAFPSPTQPEEKKDNTPPAPKGVAPTCAKPQSEPKPPKMRLNLDIWQWENITDEDRRLWTAAYPACDIDAELAKMVMWCRANPAKGHKSNWGKFVTNWLSRSQDKGGTKKAVNGWDPNDNTRF